MLSFTASENSQGQKLPFKAPKEAVAACGLCVFMTEVLIMITLCIFWTASISVAVGWKVAVDDLKE